jgi:hypothetical protein
LDTAEAVEWQCRSTRLVDGGVIVAPFAGQLLVQLALCAAQSRIS